MASHARCAMFDNLLLNPSASSSSSTIPSFLYGCAWKKERTADLVYQALSTGFRGIDVATQPRHYREDLVGVGMRKTLAEGKVKRGDLFIQTKFTSVNGQDSTNLPYDPKAPIAVQVHASIASSLHNLRTSDDPAQAESTYFDSLILHSPLPTLAATLEAWRACESHVPASIKHLGISNAPLPVLHALCDAARVKPAVVQNRFHRDTGYEGELRRFCRERGIVFQGFWTLTANPFLLKAGPVVALAKTATVEREVALYALVMGLRGVVVCNGTRTHMQEDLEGLASVREWAGAEAYEWENLVKKFKELVNDQDKKMAMARDDVV